MTTDPTIPVLALADSFESLARLAVMPEEEVCLASQKSARTRQAYRQGVAHFVRILGISTPEQLLCDRLGYNPEKAVSFFSIY